MTNKLPKVAIEQIPIVRKGIKQDFEDKLLSLSNTLITRCTLDEIVHLERSFDDELERHRIPELLDKCISDKRLDAIRLDVFKIRNAFREIKANVAKELHRSTYGLDAQDVYEKDIEDTYKLWMGN